MNILSEGIGASKKNGHDSASAVTVGSETGAGRLPSAPPEDRRSGDAPRNRIQASYAELGRILVRFRYVVVAAWLVAAVAAVVGLPSLSSVTNNNNSSFLPAGEPSIKAAQLAAPFQHGTLPQAVLVAARSGGRLTAADNAAVARAEAMIGRMTGVEVRDRGISRDGAARKAQITLPGDAFGTGGKTYVDAIRATFARVGSPVGLSLYLTGDVATSVDNAQASSTTQNLTTILSLVFILVLLFVVYRALLAPFLTLIPPAVILLMAGPVIAEAHKLFGVAISPITQFLLIVVLLGAGTDYGLFLGFRVREEMRRGLDPHAAIVKSLSRVGETITFSGGTVIAALLCLLFATFGFYQGLGPAMAIGVAMMLLAGLTLLPALLAIFGRAAFWPTSVQPGPQRGDIWSRIAGVVVRRPLPVLLPGVLIFAALAIYGLRTFSPAGFGQSGSTSATSQSARGTAVINAHFPVAQADPTNLLLVLPSPVWQHPAPVDQATRLLTRDPVFRSVNGPLDPNGTQLTLVQLQRLHRVLGPAIRLPLARLAGARVSSALYNAYRATAQFISPDGHTIQLYAALAAGKPDSDQAMHAIPSVRSAVSAVARTVGAVDGGVAGTAAFDYDISSLSNSDLVRIVPIVLLMIGILLAVVLSSLIAPWYLLTSVGLSYLAALGFAVLVFVGIGGDSGLIFFLPFLMFIFLMALGSDYTILVMTRIREEAEDGPLPAAVVRAIGATGGTVTSAGVILAGSFLVLSIAGGGQVQQVGVSIAAGILLDTFLVRTLLIPSVVVLLGRRNWWPTHLGSAPSSQRKVA